MDVYSQLSNPLALTVFIVTLTLPVIIGFLTLRFTKNQSDFLIGGRGMNTFAVALSAVSSGRSSWLVLGVSGMAFTMGTGAVWAVAGYIIMEMFQFVFIGIKLRNRTESYGSLTLLDYFETRYNDKKHLIRITGGIIIALFMTAYVAAQFNAGAKALTTALGVDPILSLIIAGLLVLVYMVLGGYIAVVYNDVVRALIMILALVIFPVILLVKMGGLPHLFDTLGAVASSHLNPYAIGMGGIISFLGIGLGSPGQPHIVVRYMSIKDPDKLRLSAVIGTVWNVLMGWGAVFIGLIGRALFRQAAALPDQDPEMVYLALSAEHFGPLLYGLLIGGVFAAILSTADSQLLVVSTSFVRDVYEQMVKRGAVIPEKRKLLLSRLVLVVTGVAALFLAYAAQDLIFWLVLFAWGGLGASFGMAVIFSLYWDKSNRFGIMAGMICGSVVTVVWKLFLKEATGIYELIPAIILAAAAIVVVSRVTQE